MNYEIFQLINNLAGTYTWLDTSMIYIVAPSNRTNAIINHLPHLLFLRRYLVAFPPRLLYSC